MGRIRNRASSAAPLPDLGRLFGGLQGQPSAAYNGPIQTVTPSGAMNVEPPTHVPPVPEATSALSSPNPGTGSRPADRQIQQTIKFDDPKHIYGHNLYDGEATWELLTNLPPAAKVYYCARYRSNESQQQCDRCFVLRAVGCDVSKDKSICESCVNEIAAGHLVECTFLGRPAGDPRQIDPVIVEKASLQQEVGRDFATCDDCHAGQVAGCDVDTELRIGCSSCRDGSKSCFAFGQPMTLRPDDEEASGTWLVYKHRCDQCSARRVQCNWTYQYDHGRLKCHNCWSKGSLCSRNSVPVLSEGTFKFYAQVSALKMHSDRLAIQAMGSRLPEVAPGIQGEFVSSKAGWRPVAQIHPWMDGNVPPQVLQAYPQRNAIQALVDPEPQYWVNDLGPMLRPFEVPITPPIPDALRNPTFRLRQDAAILHTLVNISGCDLCNEVSLITGTTSRCNRKGSSTSACDRCDMWGVDCSLTYRGVRRYFPRNPNKLFQGHFRNMVWEQCLHCNQSGQRCDRQIPCESCYRAGRTEEECVPVGGNPEERRPRVGSFRRKAALGGVGTPEYWIACGCPPHGPGSSWADAGVMDHHLLPSRIKMWKGKTQSRYWIAPTGACHEMMPPLWLINRILSTYRATRPGRVVMPDGRAQGRPERIMWATLPGNEIPVLPYDERKRMGLIFEDEHRATLPLLQEEQQRAAKVSQFLAAEANPNSRNFFKLLRRQRREQLLGLKSDVDPFWGCTVGTGPGSSTRTREKMREQPAQFEPGQQPQPHQQPQQEAPLPGASGAGVGHGMELGVEQDQGWDGVEVQVPMLGGVPPPISYEEADAALRYQLQAAAQDASGGDGDAPFWSEELEAILNNDLGESGDQPRPSAIGSQHPSPVISHPHNNGQEGAFSPHDMQPNPMLRDFYIPDMQGMQDIDTRLIDMHDWERAVSLKDNHNLERRFAQFNISGAPIDEFVQGPATLDANLNRIAPSSPSHLHVVTGLWQAEIEALGSASLDHSPAIKTLKLNSQLPYSHGTTFPRHVDTMELAGQNPSMDVLKSIPRNPMSAPLGWVMPGPVAANATCQEMVRGQYVVHTCDNPTQGAKCEDIGHKKNDLAMGEGSGSFDLCEECSTRSACVVAANWRLRDIVDMRLYACYACAETRTGPADLADLKALGRWRNLGASVWGMHAEPNVSGYPDGSRVIAGVKHGGFRGAVRPVTGCDCGEKLLARRLCGSHRFGYADRLIQQTALVREWVLMVWGKMICPFCHMKEGVQAANFRGQEGGEAQHMRAWGCMGCQQYVLLGPWDSLGDSADSILPGWQTLIPPHALEELSEGSKEPAFAREEELYRASKASGGISSSRILGRAVSEQQQRNLSAEEHDGFKGPVERLIAHGAKERIEAYANAGASHLEGMDPEDGLKALAVGVEDVKYDTAQWEAFNRERDRWSMPPAPYSNDGGYMST
ncbi:hypothetical protein MKZ38_004027 [Zalerion maritima]|uniref:Uncharacterized protein n=1 Tax=Zalerion maritima TaxID=339359 RepID=A0AAD5WRZ0_9PEZI|nr:hypothetical protein MKZ38_004027 [Zalerion maritima]